MLRLPHGQGTFTGGNGQGMHGGKNGLFDLAKDDATLTIMTYLHPPEGTTSTRRLIAAWALILAWGLTLSGAASAAGGLVHAKNFQADARTACPAPGAHPGAVYQPRTAHIANSVKREYLVPMHKDPAYRSRVIIREVTVGATTPLTGFDGTPTTEGAFATAHKVFMVPTVMVFDTHGAAASEAIVGLLIAGLLFRLPRSRHR